jgi:hypothetical protein
MLWYAGVWKNPIGNFFRWRLCFLESPKEGVAALLVSALYKKINLLCFWNFWFALNKFLVIWDFDKEGLGICKWINKTHDSILVANHVCDYVKNAHHQWVHSWYQSYYVYQLVLDPIKYMSVSLYTHSIYFQSYIPYHIYHLEKCCDTIMHMVSKFWRTLYTSTRLVSQNGATSPTLISTYWFLSLKTLIPVISYYLIN